MWKNISTVIWTINAEAEGCLDFFDRRLQRTGINQCMVLPGIYDEILCDGFREERLCFFC